MPRPGFPLTIMEFQERFASEQACREYLFACRWPGGFCCRRCGGGEVGAMHDARRVWQCKSCGAQTSVTAGTVMHKTQMPLRRWFWAAYLVATHHPGISAVQLARQLHRGDPRMVGGHQVGSPEPPPQRHLCLVHHRARGHRGLRTTALALPHPPSVMHRPDLATAAPPAAKTIRPTTDKQILPARLLRGETPLELHDRQREPRPGHPVNLRPSPDGKDRVCKSRGSTR